MSLYILVEGQQTEKRVYRQWLAHEFPRLERVLDPTQITAGKYFMISGDGYPSYLDRIGYSMIDISNNPNIDVFWLCIDSEEHSYDAKRAEVSDVIQRAIRESNLARTNPTLSTRIIVHHCCMETWFLGNAAMCPRNPASEALRRFIDDYDIRSQDPEGLQRHPGHNTRAYTHLAYLKALLVERGLSYSKGHPGVVQTAEYLEGIERRHNETGHIMSFADWRTAVSHYREFFPSSPSTPE